MSSAVCDLGHGVTGAKPTRRSAHVPTHTRPARRAQPRRHRRRWPEALSRPRPPGFRQAQPTGAAPGSPGEKTVWTEADKAGFGTARARGSNVWFTLQQGRTSEVFYPDLSTPEHAQPGAGRHRRTVFTDRESTDMRHGVARPDAGSLRFTQTNTDKGGRYRIVKSIVTDPRRDSVVLRVRLVSLDGRKYHLYALHDPALGNDGEDDRARTSGDALVARDGSTGSALVSRPGVRPHLQRLRRHGSDGWRDLEAHHRIEHDLRRRRAGQRRPGRPGRRRDRDGPVTAPRRWPSASVGRRRSRSVRRRTSAGTSYATTAASLRRRLARLPRPHQQRPRQRGRRQAASTSPPRWCSPPPRTSCTRARSSPRPSAPWVWGDEVDGALEAVRRLPRGVVARRLPVRHRAVGRG